MKKLEVFYDYICPYCDLGLKILAAILTDHPGFELDWRPCESHPRPDRYRPHSDLCARGMYIARDLAADVQEYNRRMFQAAVEEGRDVESMAVVLRLVEGLLDEIAFAAALERGDHLNTLAENNRAAWMECKFEAVPSLRMGSCTLGAVPNIGLREEDIKVFLEG